MSITLSALQKQRRDTAANWTAENPTLLAGEIGLESDTGYWKVGNGVTAWNSLAYVSGLGAEIPVNRLADGSARQLLQTAANGTDVEWTSNIDVPGTLDVTGAATFDSSVTIQGDLTVNGTTTTIDTQNLIVEDKNIVIGNVTSPTDVTADSGGITLKGTTDKTIQWLDATDAWTFSEHVNINTSKEYRIAGTKVLDSTSLGSGVVSSSLTSVGTIASGTWQGTAIADTYLATISTAGKVSNSATTATSTNTASTIVARDASGNFSAGTITATLNGNASSASTVTTNANLTGDVTSVGNATSIAAGVIVNADVNASAAIAGTKISPDFGSQTVATTGVFSHALGTAGAPTVTFTGDTNTGIYSPGADQLAISTGGTGRLFVDASGNLGIGTNSPLGRLQVSQPTISEIFISATDAGGRTYRIGTGDSVSGLTGALRVYDQTGATERLRITNTGLVGIGTSAPATALQVNGDIRTSGVAGTGYELNDANTKISIPAANSIAFSTSGVERIRINNAGNVGIGTTSPGSALDVKGTIRLSGTTSGYVGLAPAAAAGSTTYTLPMADGSANQVLTTNGTGTLSWASTGGMSSIVYLTSGTSATYTPTTGTKAIYVEIAGGGGGGGGVDGQGAGTAAVGGSGGGGAYVAKRITNMSQTFTYTIGAGGTGGTTGANSGTAGGTTTFVASVTGTLTASGGDGGAGRLGSATSTNTGTSGAGGTTFTGGDLGLKGGSSTYGFTRDQFITSVSSAGCAPYFGTVGGRTVDTGSGDNGVNYGEGGTGAANSASATNYAGGNGVAGIIRITEFF